MVVNSQTCFWSEVMGVSEKMDKVWITLNRSLGFTTHTPSGCRGGTRGYSLITQWEDLNQINNKNIRWQKAQIFNNESKFC